MSDIELWPSLMEISASMLGFVMVIITLVIERTGEGKIFPEDAKALMYGSLGSFVMFTISLFTSTYIGLNMRASDTFKQMSIIYFVLGFAVAIVVVGIVIYHWIRRG